MLCCLTTILSIIGACTVLFLLLKFLCFVKRNFINTTSLSSYFLTKEKYQTWAVVTGASDGIGKCYSLQLAKAGFNVVLISRTLSKLEEVAKEIKTQSPSAQTKCVAVDMSTNDFSIYDKIVKPALKDLPIGILVNNVGMSYDYPMRFLETDHVHDDRLIYINIFTVTRMTKLILPDMVARGKGAIINLSSISGAVPAPMLSVYSAAKAFVEFFSESLSTEYKAKGIDVQCVVPAFVATKMSKMRPSLTVPTASTVARNSLGHLSSDSVLTGYWAHDLFRVAASLARGVFLKYVLSLHENIKVRALAKMEREKANKTK